MQMKEGGGGEKRSESIISTCNHGWRKTLLISRRFLLSNSRRVWTKLKAMKRKKIAQDWLGFFWGGEEIRSTVIGNLLPRIGRKHEICIANLLKRKASRFIRWSSKNSYIFDFFVFIEWKCPTQSKRNLLEWIPTREISHVRNVDNHTTWPHI